jgi:hypothetical protein
MRHRAGAALFGALTLTLLLATTALAGGWAMATQDPPPDDPGGPNEPITIGFTLMQHGVTPVDWGPTSVVLINEATGETVIIDAHQQGATGHWVADISVPSEGIWTYQVRHDLEIVMSGFQPIRVGDAPAAAVPAQSATGSLAIQPALLIAAAFLGLLALGGLAAGILVYRHGRLDRARA